MRSRTWTSVFVLLVALLAGCDRAPEPQFRVSQGRPLPMEETSVRDFLPLVSRSTETPRCEDLQDLPPRLGARALSLIYGEPPRRRVTVFLDEGGNAISYSDGRGDLVGSDDHVGDFTSISLDLVERRAFGTNRPALGTDDTKRLHFDDALVSERLGGPRDMLALVLDQCG